ncbi:MULTISPECIES: ABC transporter permease [unclassified Planococcus (in: firmicutes)]|uniref:ABC transporter permease n=1 Tax=unclassified Planococcus (in: firmicutes) TaxID=2662419 RepID=UPI000C7A1A60|nr:MULTISPECIES: ABC transporter permease [unclassified Planococcus (in: firmicutes)]PKG45887.1 nitrate ABC transporter permease [Planococcus sp. Urea-trap-24]PKG88646.1 nitrate ABC transporter permease [Planococcus sp. Urea-3u-39]PKH38879.1 nitrate ABC transporter permease [Planococcus sp. MB-3u-09]
MIVRKGWRPVLVLILLLIIWQVLVPLFEVPDWLLPTPYQIGLEAVNSWPNYSGHLIATIRLSILGFFIGSSIGLGVAMLLHLVPKLRETFYPLLILSQNIPIIVLAPLLVIWFGFGLLPKLIIIILVCFFPITIAALDGFRQTSGELLHYMKMAGANRRQIFWKLEWPHAMPSIFSGLKIAATYSVMGAVISEWLGAQEGIGVYMTLASSSFRTTQVFVAILLIMCLSMLFFAAIVLLEKRVIRWKTSGGGNLNG